MLPDRDYPADPYPGAVPGCSFVHLDGRSHPLRPDRTAPAGWWVGQVQAEADLDDWLADRGAEPMAARIPLLTYGSNRCPSKITWLRQNLGLPGPVVVVRGVAHDVAAVWAAGLRQRDGQRPAVLAAAPGVREAHAVWFATADQVEVLDRCEGRDDRYRLARPPITVRTEDGALIEGPWCYLGLGAIRQPLLVGSSPDASGPSPVRCADLPQREARHLQGRPATGDGLDAETVHGPPNPDEWPAVLLDPDTGDLAYLDEPGKHLPVLDEDRGPGHRRLRRTLDDGTVAWTYRGIDDRPPGRRGRTPTAG